MHFARAANPDFGSGIASEAERAHLPGLGREAQDYLSWRRSILMIAFAFLAVMALSALINFGITVNDQNPEFAQNADVELYHGILFVQMAAKVVLAWMAFLAWRSWSNLPVSHRRQKLGWLVGLLVPFLAALIPLHWIMHMRGAGVDQQRAQGLFGVIYGLAIFLTLLPSILSIFVGAIRASLLVARFLPESSIPGWIAAVSAPILGLLLLSVFVLINQIGGNELLLIGFGGIIVNYMLYVRHGARLARSSTREQIKLSFGAMRAQSTVLLGGGLLCIVVAMFTMKILNLSLVGSGDQKMFSYLQFFEMVIELIGKSMFTALLFSDLLIAVVRHAHESTLAFPGTGLMPALQSRLDELHSAGFKELNELAAFRVKDMPGTAPASPPPTSPPVA